MSLYHTCRHCCGTYVTVGCPRGWPVTKASCLPWTWMIPPNMPSLPLETRSVHARSCPDTTVHVCDGVLPWPRPLATSSVSMFGYWRTGSGLETRLIVITLRLLFTILWSFSVHLYAYTYIYMYTYMCMYMYMYVHVCTHLSWNRACVYMFVHPSIHFLLSSQPLYLARSLLHGHVHYHKHTHTHVSTLFTVRWVLTIE